MISRYTEADIAHHVQLSETERHSEKTVEDTTSHWERIFLPEGQLSVAKDLPEGFPDNFAEVLTHHQPWKLRGHDLGGTIRRVEGFELDGAVFVMKEFLDSGKDVLRFVRSSLQGKWANRDASTPSAQFHIVDQAKQRYEEEYGEELLVEELVAFYIDRRSTQKYGFYRYYPPLENGLDDQGKAMIDQKLRVIDQKLAQVGIDRAESHNYVVTAGSTGEPEVVFIDTERWKVRE